MKDTPDKEVASPKVAVLATNPPKFTSSSLIIPFTPPLPYRIWKAVPFLEKEELLEEE